VAQLVRDTIQMRPSLLDALNMKVVNYSALARLLQEEMGEGSLEATRYRRTGDSERKPS